MEKTLICTVPVKSLDTPTKSRVFLYFYYVLHWVGKAFQVKLVERMRKECAKLSLMQRMATLKNLKYKIWLLRFHLCYFIVLMSSLLFYNEENSKNKVKPLSE